MTAMTFDTLVTGPFNEEAVVAARAVAERPAKDINPLLIVGASGTGKTHLLRVVKTEASNRQADLRATEASTEALVRELVDAIWAETTDTVFQGMRETTDLLVLDHLEVLANRRGTTFLILEQLGSMIEAGMQIALVCTPTAAASIGLPDWVNTFPRGHAVSLEKPDQDALRRFARVEASLMGVDLLPDDLHDATAAMTTFPEVRGRLNRFSLKAG